MRIPIREQLAALVLLSTLIGLAVISVATWIRNHSLVIGLRSSRLEVIASLKASQLASNLALYERSARGLSTRATLQDAYEGYDNGNTTASNWEAFNLDFQQTGLAQQQLINVQTRLFASNTKHGAYLGGLTNVTVPGLDIKLPYSHPNGTPVKLGDPNGGYPSSLYPNLTYHDADEHGSSVAFDGRRLNINSTILLGPWQINSTFSLFSITVPVHNNTSQIHDTHLIGVVTLVFNAQLFKEVVDSPVGLDESGTVLLIRPVEADNRYPDNIHFNSGNPQPLESAKVKFVLPPNESRYQPPRHQAEDYGGPDRPFHLSAYPAIADGVSMTDPSINSAGSNIDCQNEENIAVSIGYAIPTTDLCQWILVVEQSKSEAFEPIVVLRNILLACVFATAAAMAILIYPLAHYASRPIRRLRDATMRVVELGPQSNGKDDARPIAVIINGQEKSTNGEPPLSAVDEKKGIKSKWNLLWRKQPHVDIESQSSGTSFRVPSKVEVGRHLVESELTDLTQKFNEMMEELSAYHTKLEEKVKKRTAELEESKKAAEVANKSKTLFIANISHELKTPLNGIIGMCGVALQEVANGDFGKIKHTIGVIYNSGDLLHHLLTDLLTFAQNQAGKGLRLHEKEFRLRDLATQVQAIFQQQVNDRQINFSVTYNTLSDVTGDMLGGQFGPSGTDKVRDMCLWGDFHRLLQVCINLVSNGLKFTQVGGDVQIKITCLEKSTAVPSGDTFESSNTVEDRLARLQSYDSADEMDTGRDLEKDSKAGQVVRKRYSFNSTQSDALEEPPPNAETFWFAFEVSDNGPGIPKHLQRSIFEPFMQGDPELTKKYGGTGLGLSICLQIAKLMNGEMDLESGPGQGSKFTLRVPLKLCRIRVDSSASSLARVSVSSVDARLVPPNPEESTPVVKAFEGEKNPRLVGLSQPYFSKGNPPMASPTGESPTKNKLKVLVAEDNKVNQEVVLRMLKLEEIFDVHVAKDGQEALDFVKASMEQASPYDLIFMDIMMPNLDGRESTRLIRQAGYSAPIVALTAFADEANQKECIDSGMDYFLSKPIKRPALKHVLKTYCAPILEMEEAEPKAVDGSNDMGSTMAEVNPFDRAISNPTRAVAEADLESPDITPTTKLQ